MKIIMVGALRYSNFGDMLFAKLFYERLLHHHQKDEILLYETPLNPVSEMCRTELNYSGKFRFSDFKDADALLYISGGYFSNTHKSFMAKIKWHIIYALPGMLFAKHKKKIYISGVGGGNFSWNISANIIKRIINNAEKITVRNEETKTNLEKLKIHTPITVTSDTAHVIKEKYPNNETKEDIFLHIMPQPLYYSMISKTILPAVKQFLSENPNCKVIVGFDSVISTNSKYQKLLEDVVDYFGKDRATIHEYTSVDEFCSFLCTCKLVITPKLHVGIVSATLGKSVLSFPINFEKTSRYYRSIQASDRCINMFEANKDIVYSMINKYYNKPIAIPLEVIELSKQNLSICDMI